MLPGIGSYIALANEQGNLRAIGWAILTMLIVILLYDQLIFRPLVVWVDRFRVDQELGGRSPRSWALTMMQRSRDRRRDADAVLCRRALDQPLGPTATGTDHRWRAAGTARGTDMIWFSATGAGGGSRALAHRAPC